MSASVSPLARRSCVREPRSALPCPAAVARPIGPPHDVDAVSESARSPAPSPRTRDRHRPRQARHGRAAQGRRDHGRRQRRAGEDRRGRRRRGRHGPGAGARRHPQGRRRGADVRPRHDRGIIEAVSIPVMAKSRIGHFVEAQVLQSLGVDYIDESEVLTPADEVNHFDKWAFTDPVRLRRHQPRRGAAPHRRGRGHDPLEGRGRHRQRRRGGPPPAPDQERDPPAARLRQQRAVRRRQGAARPVRARQGGRRAGQAARWSCSPPAASRPPPTPR